MRRNAAILTIVLASALLVAGCVAAKKSWTVHPAGDGKPPVCTGCHDASKAPLDHRADFGRSHRVAASVSRDACLLCHRDSSCAVCHANKSGMSPASTLQGKPARDVPHRGDWLTRHRVEGKVNPVSCASCHARRDNGRCRACHR